MIWNEKITSFLSLKYEREKLYPDQGSSSGRTIWRNDQDQTSNIGITMSKFTDYCAEKGKFKLRIWLKHEYRGEATGITARNDPFVDKFSFPKLDKRNEAMRNLKRYLLMDLCNSIQCVCVELWILPPNNLINWLNFKYDNYFNYLKF